jgi:membrane protease YdiL (CAAX protease family)
MAFGLLLGVLFARTRSLLAPFVIHLANNLYASQPC